MSLKKIKVGFIGAGAMAEALLTGIVKKDLLLPDNLLVSDVNRDRLVHLQNSLGISYTDNNIDLVKRSDIIFLAVKPAIVSKVLREIAVSVKQDSLIVSIAAGITIENIEKSFAESIPVIRVMPNTPSLVGAGASAIALGQFATESQGEAVSELMEAVGQVVKLPEELIDSVTGLSGSGPAYMYMVLEALIDGGVKMGLPRQHARTLAAQTMLGAAKMVLETGEHPAKLKDMVTTPGGTTIHGIYALEKGNLRGTLIDGVEAATKRAREMAKEK